VFLVQGIGRAARQSEHHQPIRNARSHSSSGNCWKWRWGECYFNCFLGHSACISIFLAPLKTKRFSLVQRAVSSPHLQWHSYTCLTTAFVALLFLLALFCLLLLLDIKVLDRLFTMFDKTGDDAIYYREFISGIAPLISADVKEKVNFALQVFTLLVLLLTRLETKCLIRCVLIRDRASTRLTFVLSTIAVAQMYDILGIGKLKQDEVIKLLSAINRTASYFGDPCLTEQQVCFFISWSVMGPVNSKC